jgi:hypothetical protein
MMASLDGKITYGKVLGQSVPDSSFDNFFDLYIQTESKLHGQGFMCGRVTMEMFMDEVGTSLEEFSNVEVNYEDNILKYDNPKFAVALDPKGLLRWKDSFVVGGSENNRSKYNLIVIVSKTTPKEYIAFLKSKNISHIVCGEDKLDLNSAMEKIKI